MHITRKEHLPPHIHAKYGNEEALFTIKDWTMIKGRFPNKGVQLVREFVGLYSKELQEMWDTEVYKRLPPLD